MEVFFIRKIQLWERAKKLLLHRTGEPRCKIFVVQNISRLVLKTRRCVIKGLCFVSIVVVMLENCEEEKSAHRILPIGSKKKGTTNCPFRPYHGPINYSKAFWPPCLACRQTKEEKDMKTAFFFSLESTNFFFTCVDFWQYTMKTFIKITMAILSFFLHR